MLKHASIGMAVAASSFAIGCSSTTTRSRLQSPHNVPITPDGTCRDTTVVPAPTVATETATVYTTR